MNYRSTLLTAGAAVALAGLANAQVNAQYDHNWASLSDGAPAALIDPQFFGADGDLGIGDSIRFCYSIDVTQGGRNQSGQSFISHFAVAQGFGGANTTLGVDIGPVTIASRVSDDLGDDACLSDIFLTTGNPFIGPALPDLNLGAPGLQAGTAGYSITAGFFWTIAFEFIGSNLPSTANTGGVDPATPFPNVPLLTHLVYEVQGPATGGADNRQYFLGSTSELNGSAPTGNGVTGGTTNGNSNFGANQYLTTADQSGALQGNRVTIESGGVLTNATPVALIGGTNSEIEWFGALAFQTPYLTGVNRNNAGNGGADWVFSGGNLATIDVRVLDKTAGALNPASGSAIADPNIVFSSAFLVWSGTSAATTLQNALSWDDFGGAAPPQLGSLILGSVPVLRAPGPQAICANFDSSTTAFLNLGFGLQTPFTTALGPNNDGQPGLDDYFTIQNPTPTSGSASFLTGPVPLANPNPNAAGTRLGIHAIGLEANILTGGALGFTELTNARTAVLQ